MQPLLLQLAVTLREFVISKKVITAIITAVVSYFVKDPEWRKYIVEIGVVLLGGQALADHGKAAALIASAGTTAAAINAATRQPAAAVAVPAQDGSGRVVMVPLPTPPLEKKT